MKRIFVYSYMIVLLIWCYYLSFYIYYDKKLDQVLIDRIKFKDSVYKYEYPVFNTAYSRHFRELHFDKTVEMEVLVEKRNHIIF